MASRKSGKPRPKIKVKKITNPSHGLPMLATQVRRANTKDPMQGAATTPRVGNHSSFVPIEGISRKAHNLTVPFRGSSYDRLYPENGCREKAMAGPGIFSRRSSPLSNNTRGNRYADGRLYWFKSERSAGAAVRYIGFGFPAFFLMLILTVAYSFCSCSFSCSIL